MWTQIFLFDTVAGYKLVGSHSGVKLCRWTKVIFDTSLFPYLYQQMGSAWVVFAHKFICACRRTNVRPCVSNFQDLPTVKLSDGRSFVCSIINRNIYKQVRTYYLYDACACSVIHFPPTTRKQNFPTSVLWTVAFWQLNFAGYATGSDSLICRLWIQLKFIRRTLHSEVQLRFWTPLLLTAFLI